MKNILLVISFLMKLQPVIWAQKYGVTFIEIFPKKNFFGWLTEQIHHPMMMLWKVNLQDPKIQFGPPIIKSYFYAITNIRSNSNNMWHSKRQKCQVKILLVISLLKFNKANVTTHKGEKGDEKGHQMPHRGRGV